MLEGSDYSPLSSTCQTTHGILLWDQFLGSQQKQNLDKLEQVQWRATKIIRGTQNMPCDRRQRETGLVSLEKRGFAPNSSLPISMYSYNTAVLYIIAAFPYLRGAHQEDRARLFAMVHGEGARDSRHQLKQERDISKVFKACGAHCYDEGSRRIPQFSGAAAGGQEGYSRHLSCHQVPRMPRSTQLSQVSTCLELNPTLTATANFPTSL